MLRSASVAPSAACGNSWARNAKLAEMVVAMIVPLEFTPEGSGLERGEEASSSARWEVNRRFCLSIASNAAAKRFWTSTGGTGTRISENADLLTMPFIEFVDAF